MKKQEIDEDMKRTHKRIKSVISFKMKVLKNVDSQKHKDKRETEKEIYFINKKKLRKVR